MGFVKRGPKSPLTLTAPKMLAHYIAQANRKKLGFCGMDKVVAFDQSRSVNAFAANETGTPP